SPEEYAAMWRTITAGQEWRGEFHNKKKNGDLYWELANISPVVDDRGGITHFVAVKEDVTERRNIEQTLHKSERRFRTLVGSMDDIVFTLDLQGRHTGVYGRWLEKDGFTPDHFLGKTAAEILGAEAGEIHEAANQQALTGQNVVYEWGDLTQTIQTSLSPIYQEDGTVTGIVGIGRDISRLKQSEEALRQAEHFASATVDALSAHIAILDQHGVIQAVNAAWQGFGKQQGADPARIGVGVNYLDVLAAVDPAGEDGPSAQAVQEGIHQIIGGHISEFAYEYPCPLPEGQRWFVVRCTSFTVEDAIHVVVAHVDITERVVAQEVLRADSVRLDQLVQERTAQLKRLNLRMATILDNASNPILFANADGKIVTTNMALRRRLGYRPRQLDNIDLLSLFDAASVEEVAQAWSAVQTTSQVEHIQARLTAANGASFEAEVTFNRVPDNAGHIVCTLYDISHLKEVERLKDQFISMVSHELRTPIGAILLNTETMQHYYAQMSDDQRMRKLYQIHTQTHRLQELVDAVLDISRLTARHSHRGDDVVDVGGTLTEIVNSLGELAAAKQQRVEVNIEDNAAYIRGERSDLIRVWQNLISNAIKYTDNGGEIRASVYGPKQIGGWLGLSTFSDQIPKDLVQGRHIVGVVTDTGYGIHPEDLPHIFTRFYRGWADDTSIPGTGLGLSLTRDILKLYGGDIAVHSQVGVGTTFCFWLPITE
ncbi:MAG: PAS domain S-box protein, partial [Caldilineaceae bacterium]|nr:PAS domain S-box protein [Caldilineaceae bacterium]